MAKTAAVPEASARPRRTSLSQRNRLSIRNKDDGYFYRIVNDTDDRVERMMELGYEVCTKESLGATGDRRVDSASPLGTTAHFSVGQNTKAVVMRQRKDYYAEDQAAKQAEIDELEATMKGEARTKADYGALDLVR